MKKRTKKSFRVLKCGEIIGISSDESKLVGLMNYTILVLKPDVSLILFILVVLLALMTIRLVFVVKGQAKRIADLESDLPRNVDRAQEEADEST